MPKERAFLPDITIAQASEIQQAPEIGAIITEHTPEEEVTTVWQRKDDGSIDINRMRVPFDGSPPLPEKVIIRFDRRGNIKDYRGSYVAPERRFDQFLDRLDPSTREQQARETVVSLVEFVFRNLDPRQTSPITIE